jgi:phosphatidylglycerophosphatase A
MWSSTGDSSVVDNATTPEVRWTRLGLAGQLATVGGIGLLPLAPGTWCSLIVALPAVLFPLSQDAVRIGYLAASLVFAIVSPYAVRTSQQRWGNDPSRVVIDEALGMSMILILPYAYLGWWWWAGSVALFRLFDIRKPWPMNVINARTEWWAVMADDVVAALTTALVLHLGLIGQTVLATIVLGMRH